jgi:hypothetical protein
MSTTLSADQDSVRVVGRAKRFPKYAVKDGSAVVDHLSPVRGLTEMRLERR